MFMNPEAWSDLRKYDYSKTIYTGFYYPAGSNINAKGLYPRRLLHPLTETQYNPFEVEKLGLEEIWERGTLVAIEWSERLSLLPEDYLRITFTNAEPRQAAFVAFGIAAEGYLQRLKPLLL